MISGNHQPLLQYAERDPAKEQWRCNAADQPIKYQYLSTPSLEQQFVRKPDDLHQRDSSKYLENANLSELEVKKISRKLKGISRKLTFQLLTR
jgi:hypothetical protein